MGLAYILPVNPETNLYDVIALSPASPPPRPHPTPPIDPDAPRPSHPIALPGDPWWGDNLKPTHTIALPGDPWWPKPPEPGEAPAGTIAVVRRVPDGVTPPAESSPKAVWVQVIMEKGSPPAFAKLEPYVSTGPV
jgi:hypothetical protein